MAFSGPVEDFVESVGCLKGALSQLHYIESLRDESGSYSHWGLERVHGKMRARQAIEIVRAQVEDQIMRTRLESLWEELSGNELAGTRTESLFALLCAGSSRLQGRDYREKHLMFIYSALAEFERSRSKPE